MSKMDCNVVGCSEPSHAKGVCMRHYNQVARCGRIISSERINIRNKGATCDSHGCTRPAKCRGLCLHHYHCYRRPAKSSKPAKECGPCSVPHCGRFARTRGFCERHYRRWRLHSRKTTDWQEPAQQPTEGEWRGIGCRIRELQARYRQVLLRTGMELREHDSPGAVRCRLHGRTRDWKDEPSPSWENVVRMIEDA